MISEELFYFIAFPVIAISVGLAALFVAIVVAFHRRGQTRTGVLVGAVAVAVLGWLAADLFLANWRVTDNLSEQADDSFGGLRPLEALPERYRRSGILPTHCVSSDCQPPAAT